MTRFNELRKIFREELSLRNFADSTLRSYDGYLCSFLRAMVGKPKPLPLSEIKQYLLTISNINTRGLMVVTIRNFYKYVLKQELSLDDIPYPRPTNYLPVVLSVQEVAWLWRFLYDELLSIYKHKP